MKSSQKRIMSIAMAAAVSVCAVPQTAAGFLGTALVASADDPALESLTWTKNTEETGIIITGYSGTNTALAIPNQIENLPVTAIAGEAFRQKNTLVSISLPDTITEFGYMAFTYCENLQTINMPAALQIVGNSAFNGCSALEEVILPDGVTSIGVGAFSSCTNLANIVIPECVTSIGETAFRGTKWLAAQQAADSLVIVNHILIDGTTASGDVVIPDSVISICNQAFYGCRDLTSIQIPGSIENLSDDLFNRCTGLKTVILSDGLKRVGSRSFNECTALEEINIPDSVTEIGTVAFYGCTKLTQVHLPASLTVITGGSQQGLFQGCALTEIEIPKGVTEIGRLAFAQCENLTWVKIPDSVTDISSVAFVGSPNVTICGTVGSAAEAFAQEKTLPFIAADAELSAISLTLTDDLALNFFADGVTGENKDNYKVVFTGKCEEDGKDTAFTEKEGRYCASANVSAIHMDETITAALYKKNGETWEKIGTKQYSVNQYLDHTGPATNWSLEKALAFDKLVDTVKLYGKVSYAYFNTPDQMPDVTDYENAVHQDYYNAYRKYDAVTLTADLETVNTDKFSLVLNSRMSLRWYLDGLAENETATCGSAGLTAVKGKYGVYFELPGYTPLDLHDTRTIEYNGYIYQFTPLTWAYRVFENTGTANSERAMANILFEYYTNATAFNSAT